MEHFRKINYVHIKEYILQSSRSGKTLHLTDFDARFWLHNEKVNLDQIKAIYRLFGNIQNVIIPTGDYKGLYFFLEQKNIFFKYENSAVTV
jgi:hypothetical protein